jgi:hypothetical protein
MDTAYPLNGADLQGASIKGEKFVKIIEKSGFFISSSELLIIPYNSLTNL